MPAKKRPTDVKLEPSKKSKKHKPSKRVSSVPLATSASGSVSAATGSGSASASGSADTANPDVQLSQLMRTAQQQVDAGKTTGAETQTVDFTFKIPATLSLSLDYAKFTFSQKSILAAMFSDDVEAALAQAFILKGLYHSNEEKQARHAKWRTFLASASGAEPESQITAKRQQLIDALTTTVQEKEATIADLQAERNNIRAQLVALQESQLAMDNAALQAQLKIYQLQAFRDQAKIAEHREILEMLRGTIDQKLAIKDFGAMASGSASATGTAAAAASPGSGDGVTVAGASHPNAVDAGTIGALSIAATPHLRGQRTPSMSAVAHAGLFSPLAAIPKVGSSSPPKLTLDAEHVISMASAAAPGNSGTK